MPEASPTRRPLKTRGTAWAGWLARGLLRLGVKPDGVSTFGIFCAAGAGAAIWYAPHSANGWAFWLLGAAGIQSRLLCNMMDGMLAVEGGLKSATGELFNELPDRLEDALILVPLGYAGSTPWSIGLGWAAACGAIATAYIRAMGAGLTGRHDFRGPMAKPHRMAAATFLCLVMLALKLTDPVFPILKWGLAAMCAGIAVTCFRRICSLSRTLKNQL
jgi:phosphatidylglycerophosphate synthase